VLSVAHTLALATVCPPYNNHRGPSRRRPQWPASPDTISAPYDALMDVICNRMTTRPFDPGQVMDRDEPKVD
jgi:hypothetical protein